MSTNENKTVTKENIKELKEVSEQIKNSISVLMLLETDLSMKHSDEVYYRSINIIHNIMLKADSKIQDLIKTF